MTRSSRAAARQSTPSTLANGGVRVVVPARAASAPSLIAGLFAALLAPYPVLDARYRACVAQTPVHPCQARAAQHLCLWPTLDDTSCTEDAQMRIQVHLALRPSTDHLDKPAWLVLYSRPSPRYVAKGTCVHAAMLAAPGTTRTDTAPVAARNLHWARLAVEHNESAPRPARHWLRAFLLEGKLQQSMVRLVYIPSHCVSTLTVSIPAHARCDSRVYEETGVLVQSIKRWAPRLHRPQAHSIRPATSDAGREHNLSMLGRCLTPRGREARPPIHQARPASWTRATQIFRDEPLPKNRTCHKPCGQS